MSSSFVPGPQVQASNIAHSVWVSASAGTGKTKILTDRVLNLLLHKQNPESILCLTYTKAAASEMKERIHQALLQWYSLEDDALKETLQRVSGGKLTITQDYCNYARALFAKSVNTPGGLKIQTIHAFCESIVQKFPLETQVAPNSKLLEDAEVTKIQEMLIKQFLMKLFPKEAPKEDVNPSENFQSLPPHCFTAEDKKEILDALNILSAHAYSKTRHALSDELTKIFPAMLPYYYQKGDSFLLTVKEDIYKNWFSLNVNIQEVHGIEEKFLQTWKEDLKNRGVISHMDRILTDHENLHNKTTKKFHANIKKLLKFPSQTEIYFNLFLKQTRDMRINPITDKDVIKAAGDDFQQWIELEKQKCKKTFDTLDNIQSAKRTDALWTLGSYILKDYFRYKQAFHRIDFNDFIYRARHLLQQNHGTSWALYKLDGNISHILVDEAQDTNPQQWDIIQCLLENFYGQHPREDERHRSLLAVGDKKQSIYSFQGADIDIFQKKHQQCQAMAQNAQRAWKNVALTHSFRSTPIILKFVDRLCNSTPELQRLFSFQEAPVEHMAVKSQYGGKIEMWPSLCPEKANGIEEWKLQRIFGSNLAKKVQSLLKTHILYIENRPTQAQDILILLRKRSPLMQIIVAAFKRLQIPISGEDKLILNQYLPIKDLIAFGKFLLLPEDDLNLAIVLKSSLIRLSENQLFEISRHAYENKQCLWDVLEVFQKDIYHSLRTLLGKVDTIVPYTLFHDILHGDLRGYEKILEILGEESRDPIEEFLNILLKFEKEQIPTLQHFIQWFENEDITIKREQNNSFDPVVRIMTVHGAKGLQAPIVILADPDYTMKDIKYPHAKSPFLVSKFSSEHIKKIKAADKLKQKEESCRLLYVALTRAEEYLILCSNQTKKSEKEKAQDTDHLGSIPWSPMIKPVFQSFTPLEQPDDLQMFQDYHISNCSLYCEDKNDRVAHSIAVKAPHLEEVPMGALPNWMYCPAPAYEKKILPVTPSERVQRSLETPHEILEKLQLSLMRGSCIHALLQNLPKYPEDQWEKRIHSFFNRSSWKNISDKQGIFQEVYKILSDSDFQIFFSDSSQAEVSVIGRIHHQEISGVIDRLVILEKKVLILDYKSNISFPSPALERKYFYQLSLYKKLLEKIHPQKEIQCFLLYTRYAKLQRCDV